MDKYKLLSGSQYGFKLNLKDFKNVDIINHEILVNVLWSSIRGYFKNEKRFVKLGECQSSCFHIVCGIPYGSVLHPELFIFSKTLQFILFGNGITILGCAENLQSILEKLTSELGKIKNVFIYCCFICHYTIEQWNFKARWRVIPDSLHL